MSAAPLSALPDGIYGDELQRRIDEAAAAIGARLAKVPELAQPHLGIVLGSGLGGVVELLDPQPRVRIPYSEIPHIAGAAVPGHAGELIAGTAHGNACLILSGRAHAYEGYSQREVTILLRACLRLGIQTVVLTNAAGGVDPAYEPGEVMLISDVINLSGDNPLRGPNLDALGPRFPAMVDALDPDLRAAARAAARSAGITLYEGIYLMLAGPNYETRAELRMLRLLGANAVGMSTVPEILVSRHAGRQVLAFSLITNKATEDVEEGATHEEVMEMGRIGAQRLVALLRVLLLELS